MDLPDALDLPLGRLRAVAPTDWPLDRALSRVPDVPRWTYYPADLSEDDARARVTRSLELRADQREGRFVVEVDGRPLGTIGLALRAHGPYVYYALLPEGRGRGLATAGVRGLAGWARSHGADAVRARTMLDNTDSERVLERAGFVRDGVDVEPGGATVTQWVTGQ